MNINDLQCPIEEDGFSSYQHQIEGPPGPPQNSDLPETQLDHSALERDMKSLLGNASSEDILREAGLRIDSKFLMSVAASSSDGDQDIDQSTYFGSNFKVPDGHGCHGSNSEILSFVVSQTPHVNNHGSKITSGPSQSISQNSRAPYQTPEAYPLAPLPKLFEEEQSSDDATPWHSNESISNISALPCSSGNPGISWNMENTSRYRKSHATYSCNNVPPADGIPTHIFGVPLRADTETPARGFSVKDLTPEQNSNRRFGQHRGPRVYHLKGEVKKQREKQLAITRAQEHAQREKEKQQRAETELREQEERNRKLSLRSQSLIKMGRKMKSLFNNHQPTLPMPNSSGVTQACCVIGKCNLRKSSCNI